MVKIKSLRSLLFHSSNRQHRRGWAASLAVISIGAIAITLFSGFLANAASLQNRIDSMISGSNAPEIYLTTDPRDGYDVKEADKLVANVDGIAAVEERFYTFCTLASRNALVAIEPRMPVYSKPYQITSVTPENSDVHYFLVDHSLTGGLGSDNEPIIVGKPTLVSIPLASFSLDETTISMLDLLLKPGKTNPFRKENLELSFTVTGSMKHLEGSAKGAFNPTMFLCSSSYFRDTLRDTLSESFTELGVEAIWKYGFQERLGWGDGNPYGSATKFPLANQFLLRLRDPSKTDATKKAIETYFHGKEVDNLYTVQTVQELTSVKALNTEKEQAWQLTFVFPVVFFAVALLVSLISVRQTILHERMDIGTYQALGLTKFELHRHYAYKSILPALFGTIIGEALGPLLIPAIMGSKYNLLYTLPSRAYFFPGLSCLGLAVIYLGVTGLVTFMVSRKALKRKPVESMRPEPPTRKSKNITNSKNSGWFKLSFKLAKRGIVADKVKSGMVIIGVLGCTALLCCGYGIEDTIRYGVDTDPLIVSGASVTVFTTEDIKEETIATDLDLKDKDGNPLVEGYQPFSKKNINLVSGNTTYYGTVHVIADYTKTSGSEIKNHFKYAMPTDQVLLSEKTARALGVSVGGTVSFVVNDVEVVAKVYQTIPVFYENGLFIHSSSPLLNGAVSSYNAIWVDTVPGKDVEAETELRKLPKIAICDSEVSWRKRIEEAMGSIMVMTNAIKVFAFLLAAVVLTDLGMLNFSEKQREIATMKVLGFKEMEIMSSILMETLSLSFVGILGGLALGFPFTKLVLYINQVELVDFLYTVAPISYVISFAFTFVLSLAINLLLTLRIRKVMAVESLKSVE